MLLLPPQQKSSRCFAWVGLRLHNWAPPSPTTGLATFGLPMKGHATALVDNVMYVVGGRGVNGTDLSGLMAFE
jgi:hypothetical protein